MNGQEKKWFEELQRDREDSRKTLQKPSMSGVQRSVVEKYSDEAHFIYELLQNADDARATWVKFILEIDKLIFIHNGTRHFNISDPQKEDIDKANKSLGDINAITSVGNSSKESEATIGKFGVGFKAVFQYTSTPRIYDDSFKFEINDLIVPTLIKSDHPNRNNGETLFEFPFNHESILKDKAYDEIKDKLHHLNHPTLFLDNLKSITFECNNNDAQIEYKKSVIEDREFCSALKTKIHAQRIILTEPSDLVELWLFKRKYKNLDYCVAFKVIEDGLVPIKEPAYCYFPTQVDTGLNFIIHAAFLLTDSREGIKAGNKHNNKMIKKLAELAADSIVYLRQISEQKKIKLINESILDIIPIQEEEESYPLYNRDRISFNPFYEKIKQIMCTKRVLPTKTGYTSKDHAYWAETPDIMNLFSDKQLKVLTGDGKAAWVFRTKGSKNYQQANRPAFLYIKSLCHELFTDSDQSLFNKLNNNQFFIREQPIEWFRRLYRWICYDRERKKRARKHKIFINRSNEVVPMQDESGKDCLFLPFNDIEISYSVDDASFVHKDFAEDKELISLLKELGAREYSKRDYVYKLLKKRYEDVDELIAATKHIFDYYCECSIPARDSFLQEYKTELNNFQWLTGYNEKEENYDEGVSNDTYYPTQDLIDYFNLCSNLSDNNFLYISEYVGIINNREPSFIEFLKDIGFGFNPKFKCESISDDEAKSRGLPRECSRHSSSCPDRWIEYRLIGCIENILYIVDNNNQFEKRKDRSILLWNILRNCILDIKDCWRGEYSYTLYHKHTANSVRFESIDIQFLKKSPWLINNQNCFVPATEVTQQSMSLEYEKSEELFDFLGIRSNEERYIQLTDEEREAIEFDKWMKAEGISRDKLKLSIIESKSRMSRNNSILYPVNSVNKIREQNDMSECNYDEPIITDKLNIIPNCNKQSNQVRVITNDIEIRVDKLNSKRHSTPHSTDVDSNNSELQSLGRGERFDDRIYDFDAVDEEDYDDFNPRIVDYQKKIEKEKDAAAIRISKIQKLETLEINARNGIRYSFEWFKMKMSKLVDTFLTRQ